MAIQIPDSLYSAGNVKLDSTPSVNFYRQIEAERRAKQDAIDDYMRGLRGKVTPAGMDVNDIPAFDYMRKKWQDFGMQYRDKIARDPQVRSQFESMAADLISLAERSKAKVKAGEPVVQMLSKKENANQIRPEWLAEYDQAMKPLMKPTPDGGFEWDYDRKDIDFTKPIWKPADFDFTKRFNTWKSDLKPDVVVEFDKPTTLKQTGTVVFPKTERFNKESILQIARNAEKDISQDEDAKLYYRDRLAGTNQDEYIKLDQIHQKYFGTPIGKDENAPVRFAAAEAAAIAEQQTRNLEPVSKLDYERRNQDRVNNIYIRESLKGDGGSAKPVIKWDLTQYNTEPDGGKNLTVPFQGYTFTDILGAKFGAKKVVYYPDKKQFKVTEYTSRDNDGNPTGEKTRVVNAQTLRQDIQGSNPQIDMRNFDALVNEQPQNKPTPGGTYTIKGKKYTLAELQKLGYNEQQVSQYKDK